MRVSELIFVIMFLAHALNSIKIIPLYRFNVCVDSVMTQKWHGVQHEEGGELGHVVPLLNLPTFPIKCHNSKVIRNSSSLNIRHVTQH